MTQSSFPPLSPPSSSPRNNNNAHPSICHCLLHNKTLSPSYTLGLIFLILVAIIWSLASILVQAIYQDYDFRSPFVLTYICTSLFVILLPIRLVMERMCDNGQKIIVWDSSSGIESLGDAVGVDVEYTNVNGIDSHNNNDCPNSNIERSLSIEESSPLQQQRTPSSSLPTNPIQIPTTTTSMNMLGHLQHMSIAIKIAPIWFLSNFCYNTSLNYTSIASSTVLASTGSLFTFLFAVFCGDERFNTSKCIGVLLCVLGGISTAFGDVSNTSDDNNSQGEKIMGDTAGLLSAIGYGAYTVLIKTQCPSSESQYSMQLLFGYIGLFNMLFLLPVLFVLDLTAMNLTWVVLGMIILKGLLDNVLSDYLWARAVVLTSATVATVGLGLTIPLAFVTDLIMGNLSTDVVGLWGNVLGALSVLIGFVLVNVGSKDERHEHHG